MIGSFRFLRLACAVVALASAAPAHAGFQWTAPAGGAGIASQAPRAPVDTVMPEALPDSMGAITSGAPVATRPDGPASAAPIYGAGMTDDPITWNTPHNVRKQAQTQTPRAPQSVLPVETMPLQQPQNATTYPMQQNPFAGNSSYAMADGFGRDLPLVMAIRQIVPSQYGFVFDDGIDVSSRVSWQGGRPWDLVLQDTLSPLGMTAAIRGNVVSISRGGNMHPMQYGAATGGPVMMTDTVTNASSMPMAATPVSMVSAPSDGMDGGYTGTPAAAQGSDLLSAASWTAARDSSLRAILEEWSERVGVELYWASEYDYPIQSAVNIQGTFEEAVQTLLKGLSESRPRPMGRLHPNLPEGPAVLVIETRQNGM